MTNEKESEILLTFTRHNIRIDVTDKTSLELSKYLVQLTEKQFEDKQK